MRTLICFTMMALLILSNIAYAQNITAVTEQHCVPNSSVLMVIKHVTITVNQTNRTRTIDSEEPIYCQWGCQNSECLLPPWITWGIIFGVIIVVVVLYLIFRPS